MSDGVFDSVRRVVFDTDMGEILFVSDFSHLNDDLNVCKCLSGLVSEGEVEGISNGVYLKVERTEYGSLSSSFDEIVHAIAKRDGVIAFPSGNTALYMIGLYPEFPMVAEYITSGSARSFKIGSRKIIFLKSSAKNFHYKNDMIHLVVASMHHIGQKSISDNEIEVIKGLLSDGNNTDFWQHDVLLAPVWIRKVISNIIEKKRNGLYIY